MQGKSKVCQTETLTDYQRSLTGEIHLWLSPMDYFPDTDVFKRRVLAHYCQLAADDISFRYGEHGKPELDQLEPFCQFNISHSGGWIVCAVTDTAPVGVDIEDLERAPQVMKLARRFFHPAEAEMLESLPESEQKDCFFDLWTLKEAGSKIHGHALAPTLQQREFELVSAPASQPRASIRSLPSGGEVAFRCLLDPVPSQRLALGALWCAATAPRLRLRVLRDKNKWEEAEITLRACS